LRVPDSSSAHRPSDFTMAPSSLLSPVARQSTSSLVLPAPPWSVVDYLSPWAFTPPPCPSVTPALSGSSSPPAPPWSSVTLALLWPSGSLPPPQSLEPSAPPWPSRSGVTLSTVVALCPPWRLPPSAPPWVAFMAMAWVTPGSSCTESLLSSPWLLLFPPWLLPPSSPPWTLFLLPGVHPPPVL
ncbi:hypothetical protein M9458_049019, partial [Cirrhinus mrigala]